MSEEQYELSMDYPEQPRMTDKQKIRNYLKSHSTITCMQAIHFLGVYNLRSRASQMPDIGSRMIKVTRKDGRKTQVAEYYLVEAEVPKEIKLYEEKMRRSRDYSCSLA